MNTTSSSSDQLLVRLERLVVELRTVVETVSNRPKTIDSGFVDPVGAVSPMGEQPDSLRAAIRRCFDRLPAEFDTQQALSVVDQLYPQFHGREKSSRSQAVRKVASEYGATALGKHGPNRRERFRKPN